MVPDLVVDVPKVWDYLGALVCPLVCAGQLPLHAVLSAGAEPLGGARDSAVLLAHVLRKCTAAAVSTVAFCRAISAAPCQRKHCFFL